MKNASRSARLDALIPKGLRLILEADQPRLMKNLKSGGALADASDFLKSEKDCSGFLYLIVSHVTEARQDRDPAKPTVFSYGARVKVAEVIGLLASSLHDLATPSQVKELDRVIEIANNIAKALFDQAQQAQAEIDNLRLPKLSTTRTKTNRDRRLSVAFALSEWFLEHTGKPRNRIAAAIATDAFSDVMRSRLTETALKAKRKRAKETCQANNPPTCHHPP